MKTHNINLNEVTDVKELCMFFINNNIIEGDKVNLEVANLEYNYLLKKILYQIIRSVIAITRQINHLKPLPEMDLTDINFLEDYDLFSKLLTKETGVFFTVKN